MKILVAVPGNLHTVRMNRFVPDALAALGHEVHVVDYSPTYFEKLKRKRAQGNSLTALLGEAAPVLAEVPAMCDAAVA